MTSEANAEVFAPREESADEPMIRFEGVTKRLGTFAAIYNIDLSIYSKEFFALLDLSRCGQTTLMRRVGGFETLTEGSIIIDGQDNRRITRRDITWRDTVWLSWTDTAGIILED